MKGFIEILIHDEGLRISAPSRSKEELLLPSPVSDLAGRLDRFISENGLRGLPVIFYITEDLLSFKKLHLPLKTANIKEAVAYQLSILLPYNDEVLYHYTATRQKDGNDIVLYAVMAEKVEPFLEEIFQAGFEIIGLFPESQRYVTGVLKKEEWGLFLSSGRISKAFVFSGSRLLDRLACYHEPEYTAVQKLCEREIVYQSDEMDEKGFLRGSELLAEAPLLKEFNLLPATYKKPDYMRYLLIALLVLNCLALFTVAGIKEYKVQQDLTVLQADIDKMLPEEELYSSIERGTIINVTKNYSKTGKVKVRLVTAGKTPPEKREEKTKACFYVFNFGGLMPFANVELDENGVGEISLGIGEFVATCGNGGKFAAVTFKTEPDKEVTVDISPISSDLLESPALNG